MTLRYKPGKYRLLPKGDYLFEIISEPEEDETNKGYVFYVFKFKAIDEYGKETEFSEKFFAFEERFKDLILLLGGSENESGELTIDEESVVGKRFKARIVHEEIETKKGKRTMAKIRDIQIKKKKADDGVPF